MSVPRVLPMHDVVVLGAMLLHNGHKSDPAVDLLMNMLARDIEGIASDTTIRELRDLLTPRLPLGFLEEFMKLYAHACAMVSVVGDVRTGPRALRFTIEAARVGKADAVVALDEDLDNETIAHALEATGIRVVPLSESADAITQLLAGVYPLKDDAVPERERGSATKSATFLEAERDASRNSFRAALEGGDVVTAAKSLARLLPVPRLPDGFDHTGWRHVDSGHTNDEQMFHCEVIGRSRGGSYTTTVARRLSIRTTDADKPALAETLYHDFAAVIELIRIKLNVIP